MAFRLKNPSSCQQLLAHKTEALLDVFQSYPSSTQLQTYFIIFRGCFWTKWMPDWHWFIFWSPRRLRLEFSNIQSTLYFSNPSFRHGQTGFKAKINLIYSLHQMRFSKFPLTLPPCPKTQTSWNYFRDFRIFSVILNTRQQDTIIIREIFIRLWEGGNY